MKLHPGIIKRPLAAILVAIAVIGISAVALRPPNQNQNCVELKSIQTDKVTTSYANNRQNRTWFIELVLPDTVENQAAAENLKAVAATL